MYLSKNEKKKKNYNEANDLLCLFFNTFVSIIIFLSLHHKEIKQKPMFWKYL